MTSGRCASSERNDPGKGGATPPTDPTGTVARGDEETVSKDQDARQASIRRKKRREEQARWQKLLAYYMMDRMTREDAGGRSPEEQAQLLHEVVFARFSAPGLVERLLLKDADGQSVLTLLEEMEEDGDLEDSCRELLTALREKQPSQESVSQAVTKVVTEAPQKLLDSVREERDRYAQRQKQAGEEPDGFVVIDHEDVKFEQHMRRNTLLLQKVLPGDIFREMCQALAKEGYRVSKMPAPAQEQEALLPPDELREPDEMMLI